MMSKKSRNTMLYLTVAIIAFTICIGYYYMEDYQSMDTVQAHVDGDLITFSEDSGLYDETVTVSLDKSMEVPGVARIYYTLNGDDPTVESMEYTGSIHLEKKKDIMVYPLKAVVYYGGEYSEIYEKTYVVCEDVSNELDIDIVSITSDRDNLYDYEKGILVKGKTYFDSYVSEVEDILGNYSNRGEEWIRNAHVAIFNEEGIVTVEQNIGLEVSGGTSSAYDVKSLKIHADNVYDKNFDKFKYDLNNEELLYSTFSFVNEYNSIRLRSGSQDMSFGNIRSSVVSRLVQLSGGDQCTATRRCIVYLNGKYYGIFDMQQNYSGSYLARRFGLEGAQYVEKYKGKETEVLFNAEISDYFNLDLNDINNRQILETYVDMDNYLLYYAINVLCNNTDWPENNFEIWRYTGKSDENNKYSDGRYRFLIFDTDLVYNTEFSHEFFEGSKGDTFVALMERIYKATGTTFSKVMDSEYYRNKFVIYVRDLLNTSFSIENIIEIITEENYKISEIRKKYYDKEFVENAEFYVGQMIQAAQDRQTDIDNLFAVYFYLHDKYVLNLKTSDGITVMWNNMHLYANDIYSNQYYKGIGINLTQESYPGYTFQHWIINGRKVYDPSVQITDEMIEEGVVNIQAVAFQNDLPEIVISEISAAGENDWIKISNVGGEPVDLSSYYISDSNKKLMKYQLPDIMLESGKSIKIFGSKNYDSLGGFKCNFSLKKDEILFLSKETKCLESLTIPQMSNIESYGRYKNSNDWVFIRNLDYH